MFEQESAVLYVLVGFTVNHHQIVHHLLLDFVGIRLMEVEQCREIQFKPKESKKLKLFLKYLSLSERTVCYFLSYNFGMNWKVVLVLAGEVH